VRIRFVFITLFVLILVLSVSFVACGNDNSNGYPPADTHTPTSDSANGPTPTAPMLCDIQWNQAITYIGEWKTVCGTVVDSHYAITSNGKPTFLNLGKPYPDQSRFTIIIWGDHRGNFPSPPEDYYLGRTVAVTGLIVEYNGIAEIEVTNPSQIEEY